MYPTLTIKVITKLPNSEQSYINLDVRNEILDAPITASEIESVITILQNNKAAGVDNI